MQVNLGGDVHPVSLNFRNPSLERNYRRSYAHWLAGHIRIAMIQAVILYFAHWTFDFFAAPGALFGLTASRAASVMVCSLVAFATFLPGFPERGERLAFLSTLAGAFQMGYMVLVVPVHVLVLYFPCLMLLVTWCSHYSGMRLLPGAVAAVLCITISMAIVWLRELPTLLQAGMVFLLLAAAFQSIFSAYNVERNRRGLFLRQRTLDRQQRLSRHMAMHDALTALPNRSYFEQRMQRRLLATSDTHAAVLFLDLDGFKPINDTHGHAIGDLVLKEVSRRLRAVCRRSDFVARIGGDEFVLLVDSLASRDSVNAVVEKILHALQEPVRIAGSGRIIVFRINASVGVSFTQGAVESPAELMRQADLAMYEAKKRGSGNYCIYNPSTASDRWQGRCVATRSSS